MEEKDTDMKYDITPELLRKVAGGSGNKRVIEGLVKYLPDILDEYEINTRLRLAHFLGQIAHESDHFNTLEEYASGAAYENRRDLGNTKRGDGRRYKGRGAIQLTGRFNYRKYGQILGVDLESNPDLAASPEISARTAAEFWRQNKLNDWADQDKIKPITVRINGGYNGLQDRIEKVERAKRALTSKVAAAPAQPKPAPAKPATRVDDQPVKQEVGIKQPVELNGTLPVFVQLDLEQSNES